MKYSEWENSISEYKEIANKEKRGGHNKIFSQDNERNLYEYIVKVFIDCNLIFNNNHLKLLAIEQYHSIQKEKNLEYVINEEFTVSDGWITNFKKK